MHIQLKDDSWRKMQNTNHFKQIFIHQIKSIVIEREVKNIEQSMNAAYLLVFQLG